MATRQWGASPLNGLGSARLGKAGPWTPGPLAQPARPRARSPPAPVTVKLVGGPSAGPDLGVGLARLQGELGPKPLGPAARAGNRRGSRRSVRPTTCQTKGARVRPRADGPPAQRHQPTGSLPAGPQARPAHKEA